MAKVSYLEGGEQLDCRCRVALSTVPGRIVDGK